MKQNYLMLSLNLVVKHIMGTADSAPKEEHWDGD